MGDAGMVAQEHRDRLSQSGGTDIIGLPRRRGAEVPHDVLPRPGRLPQGADNWRVKAVVGGEGERWRRAGVCHHPPEATRQRAHRQQGLRALEAALASRHAVRGERHSQRGCQRRARRREGRFLRLSQGGWLRMDAAKRRAAAVALGSQPRQRVEEAWRPRKSGLRVRPVSPWAGHRMHAHVALRGLAW